MAQLRRCLDFPKETLHRLAIGQAFFPDHFQGYHAIEQAMLRLKNLPHSAFAEPFIDQVGTENQFLNLALKDVIDLMDKLNIQEAYFCGLSMGGLIGQWLGINYPNRFKKLIIS